MHVDQDAGREAEISVTTAGNESRIFDIRDPEVVEFLSSIEDPTDLSLRTPMPTLCLALRLLHHAVREGYVQVTDTTVCGQDELPYWAGTTVWVTRQLFAKPTNDESLRDAIAFAVQNFGQIVVPDDQHIRAIKSALTAGRERDLQDNTPRVSAFSEIHHGKLRQTIQSWEPKSLADIFAAMDHPTLLPSLADAVAHVLEAEAYRKDLWLFAPRLILDAMTAGVASYAEMLYRIFRKNWHGGGKNTAS